MAKVVVGSVPDFLENEPTKVECALGTLCVIRTADGFRAVDDMCPHETASLSEGEYYDDTDELECPLHASTFDCRSGEPTEPPATEAVKVYDVSVEGDSVTVAG